MHPWRVRLERWFTPLARRCPFSPNAITLAALILNLVAAACLYAAATRPILFIAAIGLITIGGLADAFDGIVARVQSKSSRFGDFFDHFADRVSDTLLAAGWLAGSGVRLELTLVALVLVMLDGYVGTQIEATWRERTYEGVGRGEFVLALVVFPIISYIVAANGWRGVTVAGLAVAEWLAALLAVFAALGIAQRIALAARLGRS